MRANPTTAAGELLKRCALTIDGDIVKVLQLSNNLDKIASQQPELEALCLLIAKYFNIIAHEHHAKQASELIELAMTTSESMEATAALDRQLAIIRVKRAQHHAAKVRARQSLDVFVV